MNIDLWFFEIINSIQFV